MGKITTCAWKGVWAPGPRKKEGGSLVSTLLAPSLSNHVHGLSFVKQSKVGLIRSSGGPCPERSGDA